MNVDGSAQTRLTDDPADESAAAWSPDGSRIAFVSGRDGNPELHVMNIDGSGEFRLTYWPGEDSSPVWSPSSQQIAFLSNRDGDIEIFVLNVEDVLRGAPGAGPLQLTDNSADDTEPVWSPDGTRLIFVSQRDGNPELYVTSVSCAGSAAGCAAEQFRLTNQAAPDASPSWQWRG